jgi:hypothetical protein
MKDELATILDAMRAAQAELTAYLNSADRNAELTLAKLVGILARRLSSGPRACCHRAPPTAVSSWPKRFDTFVR